MKMNNLEEAKKFINYCIKTEGEIGEVCLDNSVFELISDALDKYAECFGNNEEIDTVSNKCGIDACILSVRKLNFSTLRNLVITPICAEVLYNLFDLGLTINNSPNQIESYGIRVYTTLCGENTSLRFRLKQTCEVLPLDKLLTLIQDSALNNLDNGLLKVALDMNIKVNLAKGNTLEKLTKEPNWKECESLIIDLGLNNLIVDCNKEMKRMNMFNN